MSVFFTDSNSELWHTHVKKLGIEYISMPCEICQLLFPKKHKFER